MAYIIYSSLGEKMQGVPFPHKAGEFCGNVLRISVVVDREGKATFVNMASFSSLHLPHGVKNTKFRIGKPAEMGGRFSSQEVEKYGYVGVYLAEDYPLGEDAVDVDTDMFVEEVVSGERLPNKPLDFEKIRRRGL